MVFYVIVLAIFIFSSVVYIKIAERYNIVDNPNHRSSHTIPVIRGGGILFFLAVLVFFFGNGLSYFYFVAGTTLAAVVSFIDDLRPLSARLRLPFQFISVGLLLAELQFFSLFPWWALAGFLIAGVGFINIYNFMDGINGITGMYSLAVLLGFILINDQEYIIDNDLIIYLILSITVFGYYNFRKKARFFAGDIGSISVAIIILFLLFKFIYDLQAPVILLLVSVYGVDSGLTIIRRMAKGHNIMEAHRMHLYQNLVDYKKGTHLQVSLGYAVLQLIISVLVKYSYNFTWQTQYLLILMVLLLLCLTYGLIMRTCHK